MNSPKTKYTLVKMTNGTNKLVLKTKKTLSQDLYNAIFHPKTSSNIRDLIFKFKNELNHPILLERIWHAQDIQTYSFKHWNENIKSSEQPPINSRKELYTLIRDFYKCEQMKEKIWNDGVICMVVSRVVRILTKDEKMMWDTEDLVELLKVHSTYNKKCQNALEKLKLDTISMRTALGVEIGYRNNRTPGGSTLKR